jgi:hypothetical protein
MIEETRASGRSLSVTYDSSGLAVHREGMQNVEARRGNFSGGFAGGRAADFEIARLHQVFAISLAWTRRWRRH